MPHTNNRNRLSNWPLNRDLGEAVLMTWTAWTRPLCPEIKNVFLSPSFQFINSADAAAVYGEGLGAAA